MDSGDKPGKDIYDVVYSLKDIKLKIQMITKLLDIGSSPNYLDENNHTSLSLSLYMCRPNDSEDCQDLPILLIDSGAELTNTRPLLSYSVKAKLNRVVKKLIEKNYIPNKEDLIDLPIIFKKPGLVNEDIKSLVTSYLKNIKLKTLREKKSLDPERLTGVNHPSTAFVMLGHGSEDTKRVYRVPKGCIIVILVHSGEFSVLNDNFFQNIFNDPEKEKFLDPVTNYKHIVERINSELYYKTALAIYREGDLYPGFFYTLLSYWDEGNSLKLDDSGIVKYPFTKGSQELGVKTVEKNTPGKDLFLSLYDKSIYPTRSELEEIVDNLPPELPRTIENIVNNAKFNNKIDIHQADLFEKLGPGVYYNFVCRGTDDSILKLDPETGEMVINNSKRALVDASGIIIKDRLSIRRDLIESLAQRGPLIEKLNKNNPEHNPVVQPIKHVIELPYQGIEKLDQELQDKYRLLHYSKNLNSDKINELEESINTIITLYSDRLMEYYNNMISEYEQKSKAHEGKTKQDQNAKNNIIYILDNYKYKKRKLEGLIHKNIIVNGQFNRKPYLNESVLKEQQRAAHNKVLRNAARKGLSIQLAENNSKGFEERRVLAERQAQESLNRRVSKKATGGRRTQRKRDYKKTRKTRR